MSNVRFSGDFLSPFPALFYRCITKIYCLNIRESVLNPNLATDNTENCRQMTDTEKSRLNFRPFFRELLGLLIENL
jgi:hypothetical protein